MLTTVGLSCIFVLAVAAVTSYELDRASGPPHAVAAVQPVAPR